MRTHSRIGRILAVLLAGSLFVFAGTACDDNSGGNDDDTNLGPGDGEDETGPGR